MKAYRIILTVLFIVAAFLGGVGYGRWYGPREHTGVSSNKPKGYHCPMHHNYHSDKPGECPICSMKLVPDDDSAQAAGGVVEKQTQEPGGASAPLPPGTIRVSPEKQQLIGVKFGEVTPSAGVHSFRSVGKVTMDETRFTKVQTRIDGWIEKVFVDFTGKFVEKGQPLLTMYSPEMLASQREYLLALRSVEIMKESPLAESQRQGESLLAAARKRLELLSLSDAQVQEITRTREPFTNVTIYSPISGYVMMRNAFPKQRITPETELYTVVDLTKVWIMADVFENEASMIQVGMPARMNLPYAGGQKFNGRVSYIQPQVDPTTRTLKVRIEADNPKLVLKPDMFVDVEFNVAMPARMTVPIEAVLDTGLKQTVFVDLGNGYLEPRQVEIGERLGDRIEITRGLTPGERIVISGNFLIDSESQLKSTAAGIQKPRNNPAKSTASSRPGAGQVMPGMDMSSAGEKQHD